jgi:hypothetical protein
MPSFLILLCCTALILFAGSAPSLARQGDEALLSPPEKASCTFPDGKTIKVDYSSPRIRGRRIFGSLVPYGEVWRAGANEATTFVTNAPVAVQQKLVPAGSYTIFTLPTQNKWTLIISKETGEWGIPYPGEKSDFARVDMQVAKLPSRLENFTISFDKGDRCTMRLDWETTRASVDITEKK